jgi:hypothetical protein
MVFLEGKNGKPELIPRRNAEKYDDGICFSLFGGSSLVVCGGGAFAVIGIPGETGVFDTFAS